MATLHRVDKRGSITDHNTDRDTIRSISAMLVELGLKPEFHAHGHCRW